MTLDLFENLRAAVGNPWKITDAQPQTNTDGSVSTAKRRNVSEMDHYLRYEAFFFFNIHQYIIYLIQKLQIFGFFVISLSVWYNKTTTCHYSGPCIMRPPLLQIPSGLSGGCGLISGYGEGWCGLCESRSQLYIYIIYIYIIYILYIYIYIYIYIFFIY